MRRLLEPERLTARDLTLGDYFDATPLAETGVVEVGPFKIECRRTIHHIPTTALRVRAGGRALGVSADTAFDPGLIAWLAEADLVVHETNRGVHTPYAKLAALRVRAGGRALGVSADTAFDPGLIAWLAEADLVVHETNHGVHTPYAKLAALPAALRARMRLVHYPDDFDAAGSVIEPLRQGARYEV